MAKIEPHHAKIIDAFKRHGLSVLIMTSLRKGAPDIAVGTHGLTFFFKIKDGTKPLSDQKLNNKEQKFIQNWHGHYGILRCEKDVNQFIDKILIKYTHQALVNI